MSSVSKIGAAMVVDDLKKVAEKHQVDKEKLEVKKLLKQIDS